MLILKETIFFYFIKYDETPLQLAATYGNSVITQILVNHQGININKKNISFI